MNFLKRKVKSYIDNYIEHKFQASLTTINSHVETQIQESLKNDTCKASKLDNLYSLHGVMKSSSAMPDSDKFDINQYFQYRDKAEVALCVTTNYPGGDYMEFGSADLNTYRNFLTAYDVARLQDRFPETNFYAFDIFGNDHSDSEKTINDIKNDTYYRGYFDLFITRGDLYEENMGYLKGHNLFLDKCHLIKGFFEDTLSEEFKNAYLKQGRRVGFACLDCNLDKPYKIVFEFLIDVIQTDYAFIYMDEYYSCHVPEYFEQFMQQLHARHGMKAKLVRNAGGFGALFYLYKPYPELASLKFSKPE